MSRILWFTILGGLVIAATAAINVSVINTSEETRFIEFSVLASDRADYGVDESLSIPAISAAIIENKVSDIEARSTVPVIRYTSLPVEEAALENQDNDQDSEEGYEPHNNHDNNGNGNPNENNGNDGSNQDKGKEKKEKQKEKESKPNKGSGTGNKNVNSNANKNNNGNASSPEK